MDFTRRKFVLYSAAIPLSLAIASSLIEGEDARYERYERQLPGKKIIKCPLCNFKSAHSIIFHIRASHMKLSEFAKGYAKATVISQEMSKHTLPRTVLRIPESKPEERDRAYIKEWKKFIRYKRYPVRLTPIPLSV